MTIEIFEYERALTHRDLPDALYDEEGAELRAGWYWQDEDEADGFPNGPFQFRAQATADAVEANPAPDIIHRDMENKADPVTIETFYIDEEGMWDGKPFVLPHKPGETALGLGTPGWYRVKVGPGYPPSYPIGPFESQGKAQAGYKEAKAIVFYYERALSKRDLPDALYDKVGKELKSGWYYQRNDDEAPHGPFRTEKGAQAFSKKSDPNFAEATEELHTLEEEIAPNFRAFFDLGIEGVLDFHVFSELAEHLEEMFDKRSTLTGMPLTVIRLRHHTSIMERGTER